jgi:periplasmic protein CpxP/Spy
MTTEKSKLLWIAVFGLLILNFFILGFIWFHHPLEGQMEHHNVADFLIHELNLNNEQVKQFDLLKNAHHEKIEEIQHDLHNLHDNYFALIKTDNLDSLKVKSIAEDMSRKQEEIELVTFYHFSDVRKLCDADQKKKFDLIIDDAMRMMAPHPPGPRH